ncbi:MAG TPA: DUF3592 domain-containing protein [Schlesneria sp.]
MPVTSPAKRTSRDSVGRFLFIPAVLCITIAVYSFVETVFFLRGAETVEGEFQTVTSFYDRGKHGEYIAYRSVIRFKDQRGEEHDIVYESTTSPQVGENVTVSYHHGYRSPARVTSGLWGGPIVCAGFAAFFGAAGVLMDGGILRRLGVPMITEE